MAGTASAGIATRGGTSSRVWLHAPSISIYLSILSEIMMLSIIERGGTARTNTKSRPGVLHGVSHKCESEIKHALWNPGLK